MKKVEFDRMSGMLVDVERQMLHLLEAKAEDAKHHLQTVMNNPNCCDHGDFITACGICNNIEMDKRNLAKSMYTLLRLVCKYKHRAE